MSLNRFHCQFLGLAGWLLALTVSAAAGPADAGDLLKQGRAFAADGKTNEALWAYQQAAKTGDAEAAFAAGAMLFNQGRERHSREQVLQLADGLGYLFSAATNRQAGACALLAQSLEQGIGVETNLVSAYAWLQIAAQTDGALRPQLDRLVVQLEPGQILEAQQLARDYSAGHWPTNLVHGVDQGDPRLVVQGVSMSPRGVLVILNGDTLAAGESIDVAPATDANHKSTDRLLVSCRAIGPDYLLVAVSGEPHFKLLPLQTH
jgi:hypothetical protein